ncbi:hypothetical protein [Sphingomonas astaxanthinifaciens]|uniref:Uncharacterized protein n=1 Tax=Sphingomonas astaxanthinifaciens DSM 22298 TaxID=1123267 RepID=A0ABQ5Z8J0_9SPHN|nr:hypothetical protein [Sphingomonas astaxanthinifaciens]GLR47892.1 hypothetical protein GCM10007925_16050 [Sphingomonas astaxanthinifaciens DSM 22298]
MSFTSQAFDRRLAAFERAERGRFGRPLGDDSMARIAFARRIAGTAPATPADPASMSRGSAFLLQD